MENSLMHSISLNFANWLNRYAKKEGKDYLRLVYGSEVLIMNVSKLIVILALTTFLGALYQTIAILVGFNFTRRHAHGLHASGSIACTIYSIILFVLIPFLLKDYVISNWVVLAVFAVIIPLLYLYAPADTESKPLVGKKKRAKLKKYAVVSGVILMVLTLLIGKFDIKTLVTLGAIYEIISILPLTYKILKRRYKNYEKFE